MWSHHPAAYTPASQSPRGGGGRGHAPEAIAAQAAASASSGPGGSGAPSAMLEDIHRQRTASTKNQYPVNLTKIITGDRGRDAVFIKFAAAWYDHRELVTISVSLFSSPPPLGATPLFLAASSRLPPFYAIKEFEAGLPHGARGSAWQLVSRSCELLAKNPKIYQDLLLKPSQHMSNIKMDTERTLPCLENFDMTKQVQANNVLQAYSVVDPLLGYSQGMNYIVAMVVSVMPEENAFWFLLRMMKGYSLERLYPNSTCALQECFTQFERLVELHLPELYQLLTTNTMTSSSLYLPQWFQTVFLYSQRMDLSIRVMDLIIIRGIEALFRVGLAILTISEVVWNRHFLYIARGAADRFPLQHLTEKCKGGEALMAVNFLKALDAVELPTGEILRVALALPNELLSQVAREQELKDDSGDKAGSECTIS